jgi:hypothetical protein
VPKAADYLPVLAATTLGPALIVNAIMADRAQPTWSRILSGISGAIAIGVGLSVMVSRNREVDSLVATLTDGAQHELEHTNDPAVALKIALDHLSKDPAYYTKLRAANL